MNTLLLTALLCTTLSTAPQVHPQDIHSTTQAYCSPAGVPVRSVPDGWRVVVSGDWAHYIEKNGPGHYCIPKTEYLRMREAEQAARRLEQERRRLEREMQNIGKILKR